MGAPVNYRELKSAFNFYEFVLLKSKTRQISTEIGTTPITLPNGNTE